VNPVGAAAAAAAAAPLEAETAAPPSEGIHDGHVELVDATAVTAAPRSEGTQNVHQEVAVVSATAGNEGGPSREGGVPPPCLGPPACIFPPTASLVVGCPPVGIQPAESREGTRRLVVQPASRGEGFVAEEAGE